ncbi:MAG: hypothetical protein IPL75_23660 [Acidobacteria bacterium]|nr:hypothetical protein [Acidobacteriota bacterium]
MPNWFPIVVAIVAALGYGLFRERLRASGVERWAQAHGFARPVPFAPVAHAAAVTLSKRLHVHGARIWGIGLEGFVDALPCTIAEHECTGTGSRQTGEWFTLVVWPIRESAGPLIVWRAPSVTPLMNAGVAGRLGVDVPDATTLRLTTPGGILVEAEPRVRDAWLTPDRIRALEAWPHGGVLVRDAGYAAWRLPGALWAGRLEQLLTQIPEARRLMM